MSNSNKQKLVQQPGTTYYQLESFDPSSYVTTGQSTVQYVQGKPCCEEKVYVQAQRQTILLPSASLATEKSKQILMQQVRQQNQSVYQQQQVTQQRQIIQQQTVQQQQQKQQQVQQFILQQQQTQQAQSQQSQSKSKSRKKKGKKMKKILKRQADAVTGQDVLIAIEVTDESGSDASTTSIREGEEVDLFISNELPRQEIVMSQAISFEGFSPNKPEPLNIESMNLPPPNLNCYHEPQTPKGETKYVMVKEAPVFKTVNQNFFSSNTSVKENIIHYNHVKDVFITLNRNHWHTQRIVVKDTNYHHYLINNIIRIKDIHHQKIETTNGESRTFSDYKQVNRIEQPVCQETVDEIVKAANMEISKTENIQMNTGMTHMTQENLPVEYHYSPLQPCGGCPESNQ